MWIGVVPKTRIPTVGSTFRDLLLCGTGPKQRIDILKNLTGRIATGKMTLVMGPPGCGEISSSLSILNQLSFSSQSTNRKVKLLEGSCWTTLHWKEQTGWENHLQRRRNFKWEIQIAKDC